MHASEHRYAKGEVNEQVLKIKRSSTYQKWVLWCQSSRVPWEERQSLKCCKWVKGLRRGHAVNAFCINHQGLSMEKLINQVQNSKGMDKVRRIGWKTPTQSIISNQEERKFCQEKKTWVKCLDWELITEKSRAQLVRDTMMKTQSTCIH